jgi:phosphoglycolate phosphatase
VTDYKRFVGDGVRKLVERILPQSERTEETVERCLAEMREEYGRNWKAKTRPYEGIPELLSRLEAGGVKRAVLSNKPDELTRMCVAELLSGWSFDAVTGNTAELPHKPDPTGALRLARSLGAQPHEVVLVGDSDVDMQTAVNAGMHPAGATWGFRTREELSAAGARTLLNRPSDLLSVLALDGT